MPTLNQLIKKNSRKRIKRPSRVQPLDKCPQKKGVCLKVYVTTPRKPNSAQRKVAKVSLSNNINVIAYIPGIGHQLQQHSSVLIRGGRTKDLPGARFKIIRGKYDSTPVLTRRKKRSKYGVKKPN